MRKGGFRIQNCNKEFEEVVWKARTERCIENTRSWLWNAARLIEESRMQV